MPISNFGQKHPNIDDQQKIDDGLALIEAVLLQLSTNLSDEERQRFGSINEQNKLFANKIMDYALVSPNLRSPDVDWVAFEADYNTRKFADTRLLRIENIAKMMSASHSIQIDAEKIPLERRGQHLLHLQAPHLMEFLGEHHLPYGQ